MKRELETIGERAVSVNVRRVSSAFWSRLRVLFTAGISLGFVLFVAVQSANLMNRGTHLAISSWHEAVKQEKPRDLVIPVMPSVRKVQVYRPTVTVRANDYEVSRERRLLMGDLWSRFNQTLSTVRSFTR